MRCARQPLALRLFSFLHQHHWDVIAHRIAPPAARAHQTVALLAQRPLVLWADQYLEQTRVERHGHIVAQRRKNATATAVVTCTPRTRPVVAESVAMALRRSPRCSPQLTAAGTRATAAAPAARRLRLRKDERVNERADVVESDVRLLRNPTVDLHDRSTFHYGNQASAADIDPTSSVAAPLRLRTPAPRLPHPGSGPIPRSAMRIDEPLTAKAWDQNELRISPRAVKQERGPHGLESRE